MALEEGSILYVDKAIFMVDHHCIFLFSFPSLSYLATTISGEFIKHCDYGGARLELVGNF